MVTPECPPITGTFVLVISRPFFSATNVFALTTSSVVTPNILRKKHDSSYFFYNKFD